MHSESLRQKQFNCRRCQGEKGHFDKLHCFWFGDEEQEIEINANVGFKDCKPVCTVGEKRLFTEDGIDEFLIEITDVVPDKSPLQALRITMPTVCPKSLLTREIDELLAMESFCRDYHLPLLGDLPYLDYPVMFRDMICQIGIARERVRAEELKKIGDNK